MLDSYIALRCMMRDPEMVETRWGKSSALDSVLKARGHNRYEQFRDLFVRP